MTAVAVLLLVVGLPLAVAPLRAVRAASALRPTGLPPHPTEAQVLRWRRAGAALVAVGVVLWALAL